MFPTASIPAVVSEELFRIGDTKVSLLTLVGMLVTMLVVLALSWAVRFGMRRALRKGSIEAAGGDLGVADRLVHYGFALEGVALALHLAGIKVGDVFTAGAAFAGRFGFPVEKNAPKFGSRVVLLIQRTHQ